MKRTASNAVKRATDLGYTRDTVVTRSNQLMTIVDIDQERAISLLLACDFDLERAVTRHMDGPVGADTPVAVAVAAPAPTPVAESKRSTSARSSAPKQAASASAPAAASALKLPAAAYAPAATAVPQALPPARPSRAPSSDRIEIKVVREQSKEQSFGIKSHMKFGKLMVCVLPWLLRHRVCSVGLSLRRTDIAKTAGWCWLTPCSSFWGASCFLLTRPTT